jgi:glutamine synthetase
VAKHFIAGLLQHAAEITAVTNQYVNSYKRLWSGGEAPPLRVLGLEQPQRAWCACRCTSRRRAGSAPHRGAQSRQRDQPLPAASRAARRRLKGIEGQYEMPPGAEDDVWTLSDGERRALGMAPLPGSLAEAISVMETSELVAETLGEHVFDFFLRNKRAEWQAYRSEVTPFELGRYLPVL